MTTGPEWSCLLLAVSFLLVPARAPVIARLCGGPIAGRTPLPDARGPADPVATATLFDLLAACLRAGLPTDAAVRAVVPTCPVRLAAPLQHAADLLAMGADPATAWAPVVPEAAAAPEFEALARLARRSARSGSSLAAAVSELAEEHRALVEEAATARAERAGVLIGGPLGLCFLPAFVCLGIVPVIVGLAGRVLGGALL
ncbi:type II secretion system F family protein [Nocardia carnea]|uniref:type II secretion system F family protein n=1 Tax=Nocardia carnea TaxID=37328 RepID=UPI002456A5E7|nr:type II secretion system F family protein [Nocardia carnea]